MMMINMFTKMEDVMGNFSSELKYVKQNQIKIIKLKNNI